MQGSEPKTPSDGAQQASDASPVSPERDDHAAEETRADVAEPVESRSPENETPQTASLSRSAPDPSSAEAEKGRSAVGGLFGRIGTRLAIAIAGGAAAVLGVVLGPMAMSARSSTDLSPTPRVGAASLAASVAAAEAVVDGAPFDPRGAAAGAASRSDTDAEADAALVSRAPVWRVAQLAQDPTVAFSREPIGHRPLLSALAAAKVPPAEAARVTRSLATVRSPDRLSTKDELIVALDKAEGRVRAFELVSSPSDVWQGREEVASDGTTRLETRKLELEVSRVRVGKAVLVGADLRASFAEAGLTPVDEVLSMLDDALEGHAELSDIRPGARLRLIGTQEQVEGEFVRWVSLDAVEYFPASGGAPPVRVYGFGEGDDGAEVKRRRGWYDAKGRQPLHGGFRSPVPLARIASRFNPHRMHPVLHVVMPHNGVDFAAPVGAPVYATAAGVVTSVGNDGPCGNKVEISHAGGITSIYCHLSRFASGLRVGQHVEQRQLVAYVGQTGRVTGPHLHFGIRRNGVFIDPMTLRLDGTRVVPRALRDDFDRLRTELDAELDGIALPASPGGSTDVPEPEVFYEEP